MPPCRSVPDTIEELRCAARQHAFWRSTRRWPVPSNRRRRPPTVSICRERGRAWQWHTERHHEWMISPSSSWQPLHCREQSVEHLQRLHTCGCSWFHGLQPFMEQSGGTAAPCSCISTGTRPSGHQAHGTNRAPMARAMRCIPVHCPRIRTASWCPTWR